MTKVTIEASFRGKFLDFKEPLELCDESGKVVGRFLPSVGEPEYEGLESKITKEELLRRKASGEQTYSTAEVMQRLENL